MTRFVAPNLAGLAPPPAIVVRAYEDLLSARIAYLASRLTAAGHADVAEVLRLETEPLTIAQGTNSYFELLLRQRINEAVRANLIATAIGASLDHLAATFYGVTRRISVPADPLTGAVAVYEDDDSFRAFALLSMEARSTAGPEGSYIFHAAEPDAGRPKDVLDAACYGEEDSALYADGTPVIAPEVLVVVLAVAGDGTPSGALLDTVRARVNREEIRPIGDKVTVEPAKITNYRVEVIIRHAPGADGTLLATAARDQIAEYCKKRRRIGMTVQRSAISGKALVTGVEELEVLAPLADIVPGSKGAGYCTNIVVTAEAAADRWQ